MEWESDSPCHSHTYPRQCSGWDLEFRDCEAVPGWGLLLTAEGRIEGMWKRRLWWEMPVKESQAATEARQYCWVTHRKWIHHHSLSPPTCQHWQRNNREAGPAKAWRTGLQSWTPAGGPSMCLMHWKTEKDPRQESPLSAWTGGATKKDWPKRPSDRQLQEAQKKILIGP